MNTIHTYVPGESQEFLRDDFCIAFIENYWNGLPIFLYVLKRDGNTVNVYSRLGMKITDSCDIYELRDYNNDEFNGEDFIVFRGDPLLFFKYIVSTEVYRYFTDICKCNLEELPLPEIFDEETVKKYLSLLSSRVFDYNYKKSLEKDFRDLKKQQIVTWGLSLSSLLLSIYNIFFR